MVDVGAFVGQIFVVVLLIVIAIFVIVVIFRSIRIIPQAYSGVVERLGRYQRTLSPGLNLLVPFIDRLRPLVDMREQVVSFPPQPVITEDNLVVSIDTVIYFQVTDPMRASYGSSNYIMAISQLAQTTLRSVIGKLELDKTFEERDHINATVVTALDQAAANWGVKVLRYEIKDLTPPAEILRAMVPQGAAAPSRREVHDGSRRFDIGSDPRDVEGRGRDGATDPGGADLRHDLRAGGVGGPERRARPRRRAAGQPATH